MLDPKRDRKKVYASVLFDLGDTLVIPRPADDGSLGALMALPFVPGVLEKLRNTKVGGQALRLGVISNMGQEPGEKVRSLLATAGLLDFFAPELLFFSSVERLDKHQKQVFHLAAHRAGVHRIVVSTWVGMPTSARSRPRRDCATRSIRCMSFTSSA